MRISSMNMKTVKLNVNIRFTAFEETSNRVLVKKFRSDGKPHFRVRIFLEGPDVDKIEKVVYLLHPTFPRPRREVTSGPNFELLIWTWGTFKLPVEIYDKESRVDQREIDFDYSGDIQNAKAKNLLFWTK